MSARAFDVMIPYYGDVPLLRAAVRSVQAQDGEDWHLTVVDDGCEPGVPEWFAGLGDPRVSYLRNPCNLGVTGNFNRCVELARAPHVVLMGCDDLMLPGYLRTVRRALRRAPQAAMVQPGVQVVDAAGRPCGTLVDTAKRRIYAPPGIRSAPALLGGEDLAVSLLRGNWLYFPSLCWRTEALRRHPFRADLGVIQDLAVVVDLLLDGALLATDPEVCFRYRRHPVSASATEAVTGARFTEARRFFLTTAARLTRHGWPRAARTAQHHWSSRVHALTLLPTSPRAAAPLLHHAFARRQSPPAWSIANGTHGAASPVTPPAGPSAGSHADTPAAAGRTPLPFDRDALSRPPETGCATHGADSLPTPPAGPNAGSHADTPAAAAAATGRTPALSDRDALSRPPETGCATPEADSLPTPPAGPSTGSHADTPAAAGRTPLPFDRDALSRPPQTGCTPPEADSLPTPPAGPSTGSHADTPRRTPADVPAAEGGG